MKHSLLLKMLLLTEIQNLMAAGAAEGKARALGADSFGYSTITGSGKERAGLYVSRANEKKLVSGEFVMSGISPRYNGYTSTLCCSLAVDGKYDELQKKYFNDALEGLFYTRDHLKVGMNGQEINSVPRNFFIKRGYEK